jgi:hypothetical protein
VARAAAEGVEAGPQGLLADDLGKQPEAGLAADPTALYPQLAAS